MFNWLTGKTANKPRTLGQRGEEFAQQEYKKRGYRVIAANFFNRTGKQLGEVDFVAVNKQKIVFVEVKTRTAASLKFGSGAEAVNQFKQSRLLKAVKIFLLKNKQYQALQPQIDVCEVYYNELDNPPFSATIIANAVEDGS